MTIVDDRAKTLVHELLKNIGVGSAGTGEAWLDFDESRLESITAVAMAGLLEGLGDATLEDWKRLQADNARMAGLLSVGNARSEPMPLTDAEVAEMTLRAENPSLDAYFWVETDATARLCEQVRIQAEEIARLRREVDESSQWLTPVTKTMQPESTEARQARLRPVLDVIKGHGQAVFLDLVELVVMLSEEMNGSIKADYPRVVVQVRSRQAAERLAKKRAAEWVATKEERGDG